MVVNRVTSEPSALVRPSTAWAFSENLDDYIAGINKHNSKLESGKDGLGGLAGVENEDE